MNMFPIFVIGFITGLLLGYIYALYKKETPSDVRVQIQDATIAQLKEDITLLENANKELQEKLKDAKIAYATKDYKPSV